MCKEKKRIESELEVINVITWQDKPNTAVSIVARSNDGTHHHAYGFSKVQYPDEWDEKYGRDLAVKKALAKIAKRIVAERTEPVFVVGMTKEEYLDTH